MVQSLFPHIDIPNTSIYDYLFSDLDEQQLDRIAIIDGVSGAETSYRGLIGQINAFAGALAHRDVTTGSVVAILCPNTPVFATVFHGILRAGATATTLNSLYTPQEIASQLADSSASWLVTITALLPGALAAAETAGMPSDRVIVLDGAEGHLSLTDLLSENVAAPDVSFDPATHTAVLPYSSGTTGAPKGVILTHHNLVANVHQSRVPIGLEPHDRVLAVLPFFHIYGLTVLLNLAIKQRSTLVTMPKFDLTEFLRIIQDHRTSWVFIAPPIAVALAKHPLVDTYDLSALKVVFSGAAPLDGHLAEAVAKRLDCVVSQGYGMTETSPVVHAIPDHRTEIDRSSIGLLLPNTEARIVNPETGKDVVIVETGQSEPGELWVRGPQVMQGYLGREEETAAMLDSSGWLRTGDIATMTAGGEFFIVDRLKELIKYKGYQVAPAVLEAMLLENPDVADAAVVGAKDADGQEVPKAFVVLQPGSHATEQDVMDFVAEHVAPHEKVRMVEFIDVIPKSSSGKILRKDLREREAH